MRSSLPAMAVREGCAARPPAGMAAARSRRASLRSFQPHQGAAVPTSSRRRAGSAPPAGIPDPRRLELPGIDRGLLLGLAGVGKVGEEVRPVGAQPPLKPRIQPIHWWCIRPRSGRSRRSRPRGSGTPPARRVAGGAAGAAIGRRPGPAARSARGRPGRCGPRCRPAQAADRQGLGPHRRIAGRLWPVAAADKAGSAATAYIRSASTR